MDKESGAGEQIVASVEEGSRLYGIKVFSRENQKIDSEYDAGFVLLCVCVTDSKINKN